MELIVYNSVWMTWNVLLASISVICGWYLLKPRSVLVKIGLLLVWILFVPNTIYTFTDLIHLAKQWSLLFGPAKIALFIQFIIFISIGLVAFVFSVYFFERAITAFWGKNHQRTIITIITIMNFIIAFGVVVGRFQRTNSWELFTSPIKTLSDLRTTITSLEYMLIVIAFWALCNGLYFYLRDSLSLSFKLRS